MNDAERYALLCDDIIRNLLNESQLGCVMKGYSYSLRDLSSSVHRTALEIKSRLNSPR